MKQNRMGILGAFNKDTSNNTKKSLRPLRIFLRPLRLTLFVAVHGFWKMENFQSPKMPKLLILSADLKF